MDGPVVSIIVPVYNCEKYIERSLESIKNQTYKNLEIIVIDDGSLDATAEICEKIASLDNRIKVIHKENGGVSSARNVGIANSNGEYVGFVDGDDTIEPDMFETLYSLITKTQSEVSVCAYKAVYKDRNVVSTTEKNEHLFTSNEAIQNMLIGNLFAGHSCTKLFKKEIIDGVLFDENIHVYEDLLFVFECFKKAKKIAFTPKPLYNYYSYDNSACRTNLNDRVYTSHTACEKIRQGLSEDLRKFAESAILLCNLSMANMMRDRQTKKKYMGKIIYNIKKYTNLESLACLKPKQAKNIKLFVFSPQLYFFVGKVKKIIKKFL